MTSRRKDSGFTIIEVSLVLAISSVMLVGLMVGISDAVQRQRFTESVDGTLSFLQLQYNQSQNVINNRAAGSVCGGGPSSTRGASDCLVLGRVIQLFNSSGTAGQRNIKSSDVIGDNVDFYDDAHKDLTTLQLLTSTGPGGMNIRAVSENTSEYTVPWDGDMIQPKDGITDASFIAIIRSPRGGEINIYRADKNVGNITISKLSSTPPRIKTCISSEDTGGAKAELNISDTGSQDGVTVKYAGAVCP